MRRSILALLTLAGLQTGGLYAQRSTGSAFSSLDESLQPADLGSVTHHDGNDRRWRWNASESSGDDTRTLEGAVIGGIVFAAAAAALAYSFCRQGDGGYHESCTGRAFRTSVGVLPAGAIIGAGIGSTISRRTRNDQDQDTAAIRHLMRVPSSTDGGTAAFPE